GIGFRYQCTHRAEIDHVALQLTRQHRTEVGADLAILTTVELTHLRHARDLRREADTARAEDASGHAGRDQRTEIGIDLRALRFTEPAEIDPVGHRLVLQIAFATLIADRTVERMVDEQELHHPLSRLLDHRRLGPDHRRLTFRAGTEVPHLHGTGGGRLRRTTHDLDEAHPAVAGYAQTLMVAETRDLYPDQLAGLQDRQVRINLDLDVIDDHLAQIAHALTSRGAYAAIHTTRLRAPLHKGQPRPGLPRRFPDSFRGHRPSRRARADPVLDLVTEMPDQALYWPGCRVTKCTDRVPLDLLRDIVEHIYL